MSNFYPEFTKRGLKRHEFLNHQVTKNTKKKKYKAGESTRLSAVFPLLKLGVLGDLVVQKFMTPRSVVGILFGISGRIDAAQSREAPIGSGS